MAEMVEVEVVYALPGQQDVVAVKLPVGATLGMAVEASGLLQRHPDIDVDASRVGIYGRAAKFDTVLRDRDRVEIYRPLIIDPKEARRQRAAQGKPKKGAGRPG